MATLRPISAPQDENEGAFRPRGKLESAHEGPPASAAKALGGGRGGTAFNKTPGLTGRKAFGDLTNRTGLGKTPGKTPGCGAGTKPASRKILGDITNATPAKQLRAPFEQAAKAAPAPAPAPALTAHTATSAQSRAEAYAEDGIEQRVGKGWLQLEQERLQRADAEVQKRAGGVLLSWARRSLPLEDLPLQEIVRRQQAAAAGRDTVPECPPSPPLPSSPTAACTETFVLEDLPTVDEATLLEEVAGEDADAHGED